MTLTTGTQTVFSNQPGLYLVIVDLQNEASGGSWTVEVRNESGRVGEMVAKCDQDWGHVYLPTIFRGSTLEIKVNTLPTNPSHISVRYIKMGGGVILHIKDYLRAMPHRWRHDWKSPKTLDVKRNTIFWNNRKHREYYPRNNKRLSNCLRKSRWLHCGSVYVERYVVPEDYFLWKLATCCEHTSKRGYFLLVTADLREEVAA